MNRVFVASKFVEKNCVAVRHVSAEWLSICNVSRPEFSLRHCSFCLHCLSFPILLRQQLGLLSFQVRSCWPCRRPLSGQPPACRRLRLQQSAPSHPFQRYQTLPFPDRCRRNFWLQEKRGDGGCIRISLCEKMKHLLPKMAALKSSTEICKTCHIWITFSPTVHISEFFVPISAITYYHTSVAIK